MQVRQDPVSNIVDLSTQDWLIDFLEAIGYSIRKNEGLCFGISYMAVQAILANDLDKFFQRLKFIRNLTIEAQKKADQCDIENKKEKREKYLKEIASAFEDLHAVENAKELFCDLFAFCDGLEIYQNLFYYQDKRLKLDNFKLGNSVHNELLSALLVSPVKLDDKNASHPYELADSFSGVYNYDELKLYLKSLRNVFQSTDIPLAFTLSNVDHIITVTFNEKTSQWILIEGSNLHAVDVTNDDAMANCLIAIFKATYTADSFIVPPIFTTKMYAAHQHLSQAKEMAKTWHANNDMIEMHKVTEKKAKFYYPNGYTWLHAAAEIGERKKIKELWRNNADVSKKLDNKHTPLALTQDRSTRRLLLNMQKFDGLTAQTFAQRRRKQIIGMGLLFGLFTAGFIVGSVMTFGALPAVVGAIASIFALTGLASTAATGLSIATMMLFTTLTGLSVGAVHAVFEDAAELRNLKRNILHGDEEIPEDQVLLIETSQPAVIKTARKSVIVQPDSNLLVSNAKKPMNDFVINNKFHLFQSEFSGDNDHEESMNLEYDVIEPVKASL